MRELKIRVPKGQAAAIARIARDADIGSVASHDVYVHGADEIQEEVKLKSSTPRIKAFVSALLRAPFFDKRRYAFSTHNLPALVTDEPMGSLTRPAFISFVELQQDFWQYSHLTVSFFIRVSVSAGLLAYALIKDDPVLGVGAMIFTPFSPLILTLAFSTAARCRALALQGLRAFGAALALTVIAAAAVAKVVGGPMLFSRFGDLSSNILIAAVTGVMAAVSDADDVGRRQLLGLAMAYPFVKFPTWLGISLSLGFPDAATTQMRLIALGVNAVAMIFTAALAYWAMGRRGELRDLPE